MYSFYQEAILKVNVVVNSEQLREIEKLTQKGFGGLTLSPQIDQRSLAAVRTFLAGTRHDIGKLSEGINRAFAPGALRESLYANERLGSSVARIEQEYAKVDKRTRILVADLMEVNQGTHAVAQSTTELGMSVAKVSASIHSLSTEGMMTMFLSFQHAGKNAKQGMLDLADAIEKGEVNIRKLTNEQKVLIQQTGMFISTSAGMKYTAGGVETFGTFGAKTGQIASNARIETGLRQYAAGGGFESAVTKQFSAGFLKEIEAIEQKLISDQFKLNMLTEEERNTLTQILGLKAAGIDENGQLVVEAERLFTVQSKVGTTAMQNKKAQIEAQEKIVDGLRKEQQVAMRQQGVEGAGKRIRKITKDLKEEEVTLKKLNDEYKRMSSQAVFREIGGEGKKVGKEGLLAGIRNFQTMVPGVKASMAEMRAATEQELSRAFQSSMVRRFYQEKEALQAQGGYTARYREYDKAAYDAVKRDMDTINNQLRERKKLAYENYKATSKDAENYQQVRDELISARMESNAFNRIAIDTDKTLKGVAQTSGKITEQFGMALRRVVLWGSASMMVYGTFRLIRQLVDEMRELDKQMANLKAVLRDTDSNMDDLVGSAFRLGREFGRALPQVLETMTDIARTGKTQAEVIELTRVSMLAANVAGLELADASKIMTASLSQFNIGVFESERLIDSWNEISRKMRSNTLDLVDAVRVAGTAAGEAGVSFHELNAIVAAVTEATGRSGEEVSTAYKAMFARIQLPTTRQALGTIGVDVYDEGGELKAFGDILDEISAKWDGLTRAERMATANAMAEKKRYQYFLALMDNYSRYQEAVTYSLQSYGSAEKENAVIMDTMGKRWDSLSAALMEFKNNLGGLIGVLSQFLPIFTTFLGFLNDSVRIFGDVGKAIAGMLGAYALLRVAMKGVTLMGGNIGEKAGEFVTRTPSIGNLANYLMGFGRQGEKAGKARSSNEWLLGFLGFGGKGERLSGATAGIGKFSKSISEGMEMAGKKSVDGFRMGFYNAWKSGSGKILESVKGFMSNIGTFLQQNWILIGAVVGSLLVAKYFESRAEHARAIQNYINDFTERLENYKKSVEALAPSYLPLQTSLEWIRQQHADINLELSKSDTSQERRIMLNQRLVDLAVQEKNVRGEISALLKDFAIEHPGAVVYGTEGQPIELQSWALALTNQTDTMKEAGQTIYTTAVLLSDYLDKSGKTLEGASISWKEQAGEYEADVARTTLGEIGPSYGAPQRPGYEITFEQPTGFWEESDIERLVLNSNAAIQMFEELMLASGVTADEIKAIPQGLKLGPEKQKKVMEALEAMISTAEIPGTLTNKMGESLDSMIESLQKGVGLKATRVDLLKEWIHFMEETGKELSPEEWFREIKVADTSEEVGKLFEAAEFKRRLIEQLKIMSSSTSNALAKGWTAMLESVLGQDEYKQMFEQLPGIVKEIPTVATGLISVRSGLAGFTGAEIGKAGQDYRTAWESMRNVGEENMANIDFANSQLEAQRSLLNTQNQQRTALMEEENVNWEEVENLTNAMTNTLNNIDAYQKQLDNSYNSLYTKTLDSAVKLQQATQAWNNLLQIMEGLTQQFGGLTMQTWDAIRQLSSQGVNLGSLTGMIGPAFESMWGDTYSMYTDFFQGWKTEADQGKTPSMPGESIAQGLVGVVNGWMAQAEYEAGQINKANAQAEKTSQRFQGLTRMLEHLKTMEEITLEQYLEGYKYILSQAETWEQRLEAEEKIKGIEEEISKRRIELANSWISHEEAMGRINTVEKLEYLKQILAMSTKREDIWKLEEDIYKLEQQAIDERIDAAQKWLDHQVAMDRITKESQITILNRILEWAKEKGDEAAQWSIEEKIHQLEKEASGTEEFPKEIVKRAAGLATPLRISLEEYKKFMGEGAGEIDEATDMLKDFENYMKKFTKTGDDGAVSTKNLNLVIDDLIESEDKGKISTDAMISAMNSFATAQDAAANSTNATVSAVDILNEKRGKELTAIGEMVTAIAESENSRNNQKSLYQMMIDLNKSAGFKSLYDFVRILYGTGISNTYPPGTFGHPTETGQAGANITARPAGPKIWFPVPPSYEYSYSNDWGAPRAVGRSHKGNDIFADKGTPAVAVWSGTVEHLSGGNAGNYIRLWADNGDMFYYMHMDRFASPEGRVTSGQIIGYIGDTGNARGGPAHIHFEWHPSGGVAQNPFDLLNYYDLHKRGWRPPAYPLKVMYPTLDTGGEVLRGGLAALHPAEVVVKSQTVEKIERMASGQSFVYQDNSSYNISGLGLNKEEVLDVMNKHTDDKARRLERKFKSRIRG